MPKVAKTGPKETHGLKFVDTSAFRGAIQDAHEQYVNAWNEAQDAAKSLEAELFAGWGQQFPDGINGKVCKFKVADGKVKYVMQSKKAAIPTTPRGDDVFANPQ